MILTVDIQIHLTWKLSLSDEHLCHTSLYLSSIIIVIIARRHVKKQTYAMERNQYRHRVKTSSFLPLPLVLFVPSLDVHGVCLSHDSVSHQVVHHLERPGAAEAGLAHHQAGGGRLERVPLAAQSRRPQERYRRLERHLLQRRGVVLDAHAVEGPVGAVEGHVVRDEGEVPRVHHDAVGAEDGDDLAHQGAVGGLHAVVARHVVHVVAGEAAQVEDAVAAGEGSLDVGAVRGQRRLALLGLYQEGPEKYNGEKNAH